MNGEQRVAVGPHRVERDITQVEQSGEADDDVQAPAEHDVGGNQGGDVEQAVVAIGLVQDPEQGLLIRPEGRIEAPLSQLRLAHRV